MNTSFIISGGIGRVVASIPALEKYHKLNPNDNFKIFVAAWEHVFFSHPVLQPRVLNINQKGTFDLLKDTNVFEPEIYRLNSFFNQKVNMVEAFDECINKTNDHSDLNYNSMHTSYVEKNKTKDLFAEYKKQKGKDKVVVFQPFGSGVEVINNTVVDRSNRSLMHDHYLQIAREISNDAVVLFASQPNLRHSHDNITISFDEHFPYIRVLTSFIEQCDYFVGVCSVGQHIARAFNRPGLIVMGGTSEKNFSYPDHFNIFRKKDRVPHYTPWRLAEGDCEFSDRMNDGIMDFNLQELTEIVSIIKNGLNTKPTQQQVKTDNLSTSFYEVRYD